MHPKRIAVKLFARDPEARVDLEPFIPLFHRFIQQAVVEGLLIDVADYAHVPHGPGVVLIGHEVDYAIDATGGRTGLLTVRKRAGDAPLAEILSDTLRKALLAAQAIEADGSAKIHFEPGRFELQILDRLAAPNDERGLAAVRSAVESVTARLYGQASLTRIGAGDSRKPLAIEAVAAEAVDVATLLERLAAGRSVSAAREPAPPAVPGQTDWDVSVEQLKHLMDRGADFVLVDVREQHEVDICEIGGKWIPLRQLGQRMAELDAEAHIVVHCHVGGRSAAAVRALRQAGFQNTWNLQGGIRAWIQRIDPTLTDY
jgi:rhodanese-related sulfurtransferase